MLTIKRTKALRMEEYSDFRIFAKFKTRNILYIQNISHQNQIFIFAKYLFQLEFRLKYSITSLECRALKRTLIVKIVSDKPEDDGGHLY